MQNLDVKTSAPGTAKDLKHDTFRIAYLDARQNYSGDAINVDQKLLRKIDETVKGLVSASNIKEIDEAKIEIGQDIWNVQYTFTVSLFVSK